MAGDAPPDVAAERPGADPLGGRAGRQRRTWRHTARVPPPGSAVDRRLLATTEEDHGPRTMRTPTCDGGTEDTYSLTLAGP